MAGKVRLFDKIGGLLMEVNPDLVDEARKGRRASRTLMEVDILWTPEEEAQRDAEEAEAAAEKVKAAEAARGRQAARQASLAKLQALGLSEDDIKAILAGG